jgi:hypothetical protein
MILLFAFSIWLATALSALGCISVGSQSVVHDRPSIYCDDPDYGSIEGVSIMMIVLLVTIPVVGLVYLVFRCPNKHDRNSWIWYWCSVLWEPYHENEWYMEFVVLARRFVISALVVVKNLASYEYGLWLLTMAHSVNAIHQIWKRPQQHRRDQWSEVMALVSLPMLSSLLMVSNAPYTTGMQILVCLLVVGVGLTLIGHLLRHLYLVYCQPPLPSLPPPPVLPPVTPLPLFVPPPPPPSIELVVASEI